MLWYHFDIIRLALLFIWLTSLLALVEAKSGLTATFTQEECFTTFGTSSVRHVPTSTQIFTFSVQLPAIVASSATVTVSPTPTTVTKTTTSTATITSTNSQVSNIFTTTTTPISITTTVSTTTSTETDTSTISTVTSITTGTTTISTASGFTPLASQLSSQGYTPNLYTGSQRRSFAAKPKSLASRAGAGSLAARAKAISNKSRMSKYPLLVHCKVEVEKVTYKPIYKPCQKTTTVTVAPSTSTATSTVTITSTSTVVPPSVSTTITTTAAISTITSTLTTSTSITTTTVQTQTMTVQQPAATEYAACQPNNIIDMIDGSVVDDFRLYYTDEDDDQILQYAPSPTNSLECCIFCQQSLSCTAYAFYLNTNVCQYSNIAAGNPNYYLSYNDYNDRSYIVGNGANGMVGVAMFQNSTNVD